MINAIYIHIPFCLRKCDYCDFLSFKSSEKDRKNYVNYLIEEIKLYPKYNYDTVYFGGGTPSLLDEKDIEKILAELNINKDAEITLEGNPKTLTYEKLKSFKKAGINRISLGIQSFNNEFLKKLGRLHSKDEGVLAYENARKVGFKNISLDLMFSLPGQNLKDVRDDLKKLISLEPEHFSIYSLIWEPDTVFYDKLEAGEFKETDNDLEAKMYEMIIEESTKNGYNHYEISNFAKPNYEAKHNSKYWRNLEYVGVGLGASGYIGNERYKNEMNFEKYYDKISKKEKPILEVEKVTELTKEEYRHILGFRLLKEGIVPSIKDNYIKIYKELLENNFIKETKFYNKNREEKRYTLTKKGLFLANDVLEKFI